MSGVPDKRKHWENRYAAPDRSPGKPSEFLQALLPDLPPGAAIDIASGDGRHSLLLARAGHPVTAVDFAHSALTRLQSIARQDRLPISPVQADLTSFPLPCEHFTIAIKMFYLQRELFEPLKQTLAPGGVAVLETFLIDQKTIGHPRNPAFLLERGELLATFSDFEVLEHEEGLFDTGREMAYLSRLAARKVTH